MCPEFKAKCSKCGQEFKCRPGELNSTKFLGTAGKFLYLPKCPHCDNWRGNQMFEQDGSLSVPLR